MEMVVEQKNLAFKVLRAPKIDKCYDASIPVKQILSDHTFDIPVFKGLSQIPQR